MRSGVANSEILKSYLALLCMGKRQRMDTHAASWFELAPQMNQLLLGSRINGKAIDFGTLECGYTAMAASLVSTPLLVRADSGFCSLKLMQSITAQAKLVAREIAFVLKWNPRTSPVEAIAAKRVTDTATVWVSARAGKRECLWQQFGKTPSQHSEFKSDIALERLPSGKFDINYLVRHKARRRRIKTVMQELMFNAARMIHHAGRWVVGLGQSDPAFAVFERHYAELNTV